MPKGNPAAYLPNQKGKKAKGKKKKGKKGENPFAAAHNAMAKK